MAQKESFALKRNDKRVIIHFVSSESLLPCPSPSHQPKLCQDYDCFYAAVFERENPQLRQVPFAVQQKQIIVTCNYEARRRGLYKLQLVKEARQKCPEVIIALGEDLTRFRNASKENYLFLSCYAWNHKVERLGFDEVSIRQLGSLEFSRQRLTLAGLHGRDRYGRL